MSQIFSTETEQHPPAPQSDSAGSNDRSDDYPVIELRDISKVFGRIIALSEVSLTVDAGQVTCLLGDNGAGKSTLIKILAGFHRPSSGEYLLQGKRVRFDSPREALSQGIATVYQDLALVPLMSIWRNFFLGSEPEIGWGPFRRYDVDYARETVRQQLDRMGIEVRDPDQPVGTMSGGERQSLAIARAIYFGARVLILDEPTAALGVRQAALVLRYIREASRSGIAVIFITHNPNHADVVGDRFVILKRGRVFAQYTRQQATLDRLMQGMAGGDELDELRQELARL